MPTTSFSYAVDSSAVLEGDLSSFQVPNCLTITGQEFIRTDTLVTVDYIEADTVSNQFSLLTLDVDQTLRGSTIEFMWMITLSDGQTGAVDTFSVEFTLLNNELPYFEPTLTSSF